MNNYKPKIAGMEYEMLGMAYAPGPIKSLSDEEIAAIYPGIPIVRRKETPEESQDRVRKNFALIHRSSRTKKRQLADETE